MSLSRQELILLIGSEFNRRADLTPSERDQLITIIDKSYATFQDNPFILGWLAGLKAVILNPSLLAQKPSKLAKLPPKHASTKFPSKPKRTKSTPFSPVELTIMKVYREMLGAHKEDFSEDLFLERIVLEPETTLQDFEKVKLLLREIEAKLGQPLIKALK